MALFGRRADLVTGPSGERIDMAAVPIIGKRDWWEYMPIDVHEPFAGAFQRVMPERRENCLAFSAVYACVSLIAEDIGKLRIKLCENKNGIWTEVQSNAFSHVLRKPNRYQTRIQFLVYWVASKLLNGNAYILKERDERRVVTALYPLDPACVRPLVTDDGDVYYEIGTDNLSGVRNQIIVPAREIIHDRAITLFHPLLGVSPIYACAFSATQGMRIQSNSARFFQNMSRPSGQLTAPGNIDDATASRIKQHFEQEFSGHNIGRVLVTGSGLKYEAMSIPAEQAQLIEQLKWTVEDVARAFKMPLHKLAAGNPTVGNAVQFNQEYYGHTLQRHIEDIELLLDEGLALPPGYGTELDLDGLIRMDPQTQADMAASAIGAGYMSPNEARYMANLPPVKGGETPYLQQQNYSLAALDERDRNSPLLAPPPRPAAAEEEDVEAEARATIAALRKGFEYAPI